MTRQNLLSTTVLVLLLAGASSAQAVMATTDPEGGGGGYYPTTPAPTTGGSAGSGSGTGTSTTVTNADGSTTTTTTHADGSITTVSKDKNGNLISTTTVAKNGETVVEYAESTSASPEAIAAMEAELKDNATLEMPTKDELLGDLSDNGIYDKKALGSSYDHLMNVANGKGVDLWTANMNPDYAKAVADPTNPSVSPLASPTIEPPKENTAHLNSSQGALTDVANGVPNDLTATQEANTNSSAFANATANLEDAAANVEVYLPPGTEGLVQQQ